MNSVIVSGHMGGDPEIFYSSEGTPVASFSIAFRSGRSKTNWVRLVCFGKQAEIAEKFLHKGAKILVSSELEQQKWTTENGEQRNTFQLVVNKIDFLRTDGRGFSEGQDTDDTPF